MQDDERYVRERWDWLRVFDAGYFSERDNLDRFGVYLPSPLGGGRYAGFHPTEAEAWSAARAVTEQREEEILQVDEDIAWVKKQKMGCSPRHELETASEVYSIPRRILARLKSIRADLKRGMKEQP